jgi:hypothetical protein
MIPPRRRLGLLTRPNTHTRVGAFYFRSSSRAVAWLSVLPSDGCATTGGFALIILSASAIGIWATTGGLENERMHDGQF